MVEQQPDDDMEMAVATAPAAAPAAAAPKRKARRAKCTRCGKDCAVNSDGSLHSHFRPDRPTGAAADRTCS